MRYNSKLMIKELRGKMLVDKDTDTSISGRKAAALSGVSVATFSRIIRGNEPDLTTFALICKWLSKPMESFFSKSKKQP